jgi:aspartyl-tRNA(Asn)/glutamyl-tRNA(Gln) amidotransferase subunit C
MATDRTVTQEVVRKVAQLSRVRVPEDQLLLWTEQLGRIVSYIDQIERIPEEAFSPAAEPAATPVRADEARPGQGREVLERNTARQYQGFGVVPRVVGSAE